MRKHNKKAQQENKTPAGAGRDRLTLAGADKTALIAKHEMRINNLPVASTG